jgi:integrase
MLNTLFTAALKHGIIQHNPMDMVFHTKHDREHGKALSKEEENKLLTQTAGTPYQRMFAVGLYTGMRPNEYKTAKIEGNFIVANNSKRKNGKVELKKIPITPMLRPYLEGVTQLSFVRCEALRLKMKEILPDHKLYDLRTTFYTRCMECGIAEPAIKKYVGHTLGGLADTYTDLSDEFLLKEGEKFKY